ncbi:MAG: Maf family protein [Tepidisphaeraceae bacterium]
MLPLVLASRSPQRVNLLREAGIRFTCDPADIDESIYPEAASAVDVARHLALAKSRATAARHPSAFTLGADTVVALGDTLLGKPADADHARRMLGDLSGTTHVVITGIAIVCPQQSIESVEHEISSVQMRKLSDAEIEAYVASRQWEGKAGGYGIQDQDPFVTCLTGSRSNIIGLPIERTVDLLQRVGFNR